MGNVLSRTAIHHSSSPCLRERLPKNACGPKEGRLMCVLPQGTMKQPEPPGEMQTTYIILEAPLHAKICCRNVDELLAHCPCICKTCKKDEARDSPGAGSTLSWRAAQRLVSPNIIPNLQVLSACRCLAQCFLCCSPALNPSSGPLYRQH